MVVVEMYSVLPLCLNRRHLTKPSLSNPNLLNTQQPILSPLLELNNLGALSVVLFILEGGNILWNK